MGVETGDDRKALEAAIAAAVKQVTGPIEKRVTALAARVEGFKLAAKHAEEEISALLADKIDLTVQVQKREPFAVAAGRPAATRQTRDRPRAAPTDNGNLPAGERVVLTAVAQYPEGAERTQLSILTGYKRSTRDRYLQFLAQKDFIEVRGDRLLATDACVSALGDFEPLPTGDALRE